MVNMMTAIISAGLDQVGQILTAGSSNLDPYPDSRFHQEHRINISAKPMHLLHGDEQG